MGGNCCLPPASDRFHLHEGFGIDRGVLTYLGPIEDFPDRYLRQALCGVEMTRGRAGLIAFLEQQLTALKRGTA